MGNGIRIIFTWIESNNLNRDGLQFLFFGHSNVAKTFIISKRTWAMAMMSHCALGSRGFCDQQRWGEQRMSAFLTMSVSITIRTGIPTIRTLHLHRHRRRFLVSMTRSWHVPSVGGRPCHCRYTHVELRLLPRPGWKNEREIVAHIIRRKHVANKTLKLAKQTLNIACVWSSCVLRGNVTSADLTKSCIIKPTC